MTAPLVLVTASVVGGPHDGWHGRIKIPAGGDKVRYEGEVYRILREDGNVFLVHPRAAALYWPA